MFYVNINTLLYRYKVLGAVSIPGMLLFNRLILNRNIPADLCTGGHKRTILQHVVFSVCTYPLLFRNNSNGIILHHLLYPSV